MKAFLEPVWVAPLRSRVIAPWSRMRPGRMIGWLTVRTGTELKTSDRLRAHGGTIHILSAHGTAVTGGLTVPATVHEEEAVV
jgi:hypothetical protein